MAEEKPREEKTPVEETEKEPTAVVDALKKILENQIALAQQLDKIQSLLEW